MDYKNACPGISEITPLRVHNGSKLIRTHVKTVFISHGQLKIIVITHGCSFLRLPNFFNCPQKLREPLTIMNWGEGCEFSFHDSFAGKHRRDWTFSLIVLYTCVLEISFWSLLSDPSSPLITLCFSFLTLMPSIVVGSTSVDQGKPPYKY